MKKWSFILIIILILSAIGIMIYSYYNDSKQVAFQNKVATKESKDINNDIVVAQLNTIDYNEEEKINRQKEYNNNIKNRTIDKVSMQIKENTLTTTSAIIVITDKNKECYSFGESYAIEKNIIGNWWKQLSVKEEYIETPFTGHGANGITQIKIDWSTRYGTLKKGKYRIVKYVNDNKIYAEFIIK